jgi:restriction system protein
VVRPRDGVRYLAFAGVVMGAIAYAKGASPGWTLATAIVAPLAAVLAYRFGKALLAGAFRPAQHGPAGVEEMSGEQFEDYVAQIVRSCGLPVIMTTVTGDWGVDLIVGHRPDRVAIQCKRHSRPIGAGAVQEVVAGAPMQGCTRTMVVSNQEFTPAARRLAEVHGCTLVGGSELPLLGKRIRHVAGRAETA